MNLLLKDPDAILDYAVDWGAEYLGDDLLAESRWTIEPGEAGDAEVVSESFQARAATVKVARGLPGRVYRLTNHVVLESGRVDRRSIVLRVEKR